MDRKTVGLIAIVAAALFCACPGAFATLMGGMFAIVSQIPGANIDVGGSSDPAAALSTGLAMLCPGSLAFLVGAGVIVWGVRARRS